MTPAVAKPALAKPALADVTHVARTPEDNEEEVDDSQGREQDLLSGRCGTRTHDLSRVKAAL
jgi:hypothetical protein